MAEHERVRVALIFVMRLFMDRSVDVAARLRRLRQAVNKILY